ncbi:MAG TPA: recombinase family protein [Sporichthyaceae bacterium]
MVGYTRLSSDTDRSTSIARQRDLIEQTARARGWVLVGIEDDVDVSATKSRLDRRGLAKIRAMAVTGAIDGVLTWRVDRIARSVRDLAELTEEWTSQNVSLTSCTESFDTSTPSGRAMLQLLSVFAELEAATIRERVLASRAALRKGQRWGGGTPPFGYRIVDRDGGGKVLEVDPEEKGAVERVVADVLGGASLNVCVKWLNDNGHRPHRAEKWTVQALKVVLTGYSLLGQQTHKDKVIRDEAGYPMQFWDPILTEEQSQQLRQRMSTGAAPGRKDTRGVKSSPVRLLSGAGLLECSGCGGPMWANQSNARPCYKCPSRECPQPMVISAEPLEQWIVDQWVDHVGAMPHGHFTVTTGAPEELPRVEEALAAAATELAGALADDDREDDVEVLGEKLKALKARRTELLAAPREGAVVWHASGLTFLGAWDQAEDSADPIGLRRALVRQAVERIVVRPGVRGRKGVDTDRFTVRWAEGLDAAG